MNVTCPECRSVFRVDPAKITSVSLRARCSVCGGIIPVGASAGWADEVDATAASSPRNGGEAPRRSQEPHTATRGAAAPRIDAGTPVPGAGRVPSATHAPTGRPDAVSSSSPATGARGTAAGAVPSAAGSMPQSGTRPRTPPFSAPVGSSEPAGGSGQVAAPKSIAQASPGAEHPASPEPAAPRAATQSTPPSFGAPLPPPPRSGIAAPPQRVPTPAPAAAGSGASSGLAAAFSTPSTPAPAAGGAAGGRRPINPFLANDPNQKARRLARALVSDMVAYHPTKREEGLRSGSLKQLFREEIKKSYEEYVEQVGREFAESTSHFQEALNDVLAGGRKIF